MRKFPAREPHDRANEADDLAAGQFLMQPAGDFDHREQPAAPHDLPAGWRRHVGENLEQGALGGTVAAYDCNRLAAAHFKIDVAEHPRAANLLRGMRPAVAHQAQPLLLRPEPSRQRQTVALPHPLHCNDDVGSHRYRTSAKYCEVYRNSGQAIIQMTRVLPIEQAKSTGSGTRPSTRMARNPSMIPTIGLSLYHTCHRCGTLWKEYITGVASIHNCITNGSANTVSNWYVPSAETTKPMPVARRIVSSNSIGNHSRGHPTGVRYHAIIATRISPATIKSTSEPITSAIGKASRGSAIFLTMAALK